MAGFAILVKIISCFRSKATFRGNIIFSSAFNIEILFLVHIPLICEPLFYNFCVNQSVSQATKDIM